MSSERVPWAFRNEFDAAWISVVCLSQLFFVASIVVARFPKTKSMGFPLLVVAEVIMILYEMVLMGSRMNELNGVGYIPMSDNNEFIGWRSPEGGNCTLDAFTRAKNLTGTGDGVCNVLWFSVGGSLLTTDYVRVTVGLGLVLYPILSGFTIFLDGMLEKESPTRTRDRLLLQALVAIVTFLVENQQFCVLMPLTSIVYGGSGCIALDVPSKPVTALCFYKWASTLVPGIGLAIAGVLLGALGAVMKDKAGAIVAVVGVFIGAPGVIFVGFWLAGGFGIGTWFFWAQLVQWSPLALLKLILPLDVFAFSFHIFFHPANLYASNE